MSNVPNIPVSRFDPISFDHRNIAILVTAKRRVQLIAETEFDDHALFELGGRYLIYDDNGIVSSLTVRQFIMNYDVIDPINDRGWLVIQKRKAITMRGVGIAGTSERIELSQKLTLAMSIEEDQRLCFRFELRDGVSLHYEARRMHRIHFHDVNLDFKEIIRHMFAFSEIVTNIGYTLTDEAVDKIDLAKKKLYNEQDQPNNGGK